MKKLVEHYCELPHSIWPALWRVWHQVLNLLDADYSQVFQKLHPPQHRQFQLHQRHGAGVFPEFGGT